MIACEADYPREKQSSTFLDSIMIAREANCPKEEQIVLRKKQIIRGRGY